MPLRGGTDLLVAIDERLAAPSTLVDLRTIPGSADIVMHRDGSVTIGAAARIADLAKDHRIAAQFPALAQACDVVGTPVRRQFQ